MIGWLETDRQWPPCIERCTHVILQDSSIGESPVYTHPLVSFPSDILGLLYQNKSNIHKLSWKLILHITFSIFGQPFRNRHSFSSRYPERLHWTARELLHPDPPVSSECLNPMPGDQNLAGFRPLGTVMRAIPTTKKTLLHQQEAV